VASAAAIGDALRKEVAHACRVLVLELDRELRRATPVDTGHARRNWVPSVGQQLTEPVEDDAAHGAGIQQIIAYTLSQGALWVSNAVPYIQRLNYGHSTQAPAGFVEVAIDRAFATAREKLARKGSRVDLGAMHQQWKDEQAGTGADNVASAYSPFGGSDD
jgi:hypothetical protein